MRIQATEYVGVGFPTDLGKRFANQLLQLNPDWMDLTIDVRRLPARILISAFFGSFFQQIYEANPAILDLARKIRWDVDHAFQKENIDKWSLSFDPFVS